jgi:hypothetical protein
MFAAVKAALALKLSVIYGSLSVGLAAET